LAAENPFVFDRPLEDAEQLVGRSGELSELISAVGARQDAIVAGPQRHGKTSLVNAALAGSVGRLRRTRSPRRLRWCPDRGRSRAPARSGVCTGNGRPARWRRRSSNGSRRCRSWALTPPTRRLVSRACSRSPRRRPADPQPRVDRPRRGAGRTRAPGAGRAPRGRQVPRREPVGLVFIAPELPLGALAIIIDRSARVSLGRDRAGRVRRGGREALRGHRPG